MSRSRTDSPLVIVGPPKRRILKWYIRLQRLPWIQRSSNTLWAALFEYIKAAERITDYSVDHNGVAYVSQSDMEILKFKRAALKAVVDGFSLGD